MANKGLADAMKRNWKSPVYETAQNKKREMIKKDRTNVPRSYRTIKY